MMKTAIHINEVLKLLDKAAAEKSQVNLKAWKDNGEVVEYNGWYVHGSHWRGGLHRLRNPQNGQIRNVCDVFIFEFNGQPVYL